MFTFLRTHQVERAVSLRHAAKLRADKRAFCLVVYYTGCRVSEALVLTPQQVNKKRPDLYIELKDYYQLDPAKWLIS